MILNWFYRPTAGHLLRQQPGHLDGQITVCLTTGNSLATCSLFVSLSTRSSRDFPTVDLSFSMHPLHLLAETQHHLFAKCKQMMLQ
jgi:hypothetical protein